jgi:DNA-binding winged helix-turn-helix (wHTH) protein
LLYSFEDFVLDSDRRELRCKTDLVALEPQVFDLLEYLIRNRQRVASKDDLLAAIWGDGSSRNRCLPPASTLPAPPSATATRISA